MTPHPHTSHSGRAMFRHGRTARRSMLVVAIALVSGAPLVAQALGESTAPAASATAETTRSYIVPERLVPGVPTLPELGAELASPDPEAVDLEAVDTEPVESRPVIVPEPDSTDPEPAVVAEPAVDPITVVLTDTYTWDERGPRVTTLQQAVGVDADGWYGHTTHGAHLAALEQAGLPTDTVPVPALPPGPSAGAWAALRDCESGGNYSITNPSGKYRGAYQFDRSTWNSVAGRHAPTLVGVDPAAASPADQDSMARALYSERGARPWPQCGRVLG